MFWFKFIRILWNDEYKIYINQDGKSARVRGPRNYTITLTDGKISSN